MKRSILYVGPSPWDPDPGLALRGRANLALRISGGWARWRCPYCGAKTKVKLRPGRATVLDLVHEEWCPVLTDREARG